ncbi:MAG: hypothetical protein WAO08_25790 [Hyphomicrobiaceae bacterium]
MRSVVFTVPGSYRRLSSKTAALCVISAGCRSADEAMAAGVTDRLSEVADIVKVLEDWEES